MGDIKRSTGLVDFVAKYNNASKEELTEIKNESDMIEALVAEKANRGFVDGMTVKLQEGFSGGPIEGFTRLDGPGWYQTRRNFNVGDEITLVGKPTGVIWQCKTADGAVVFLHAEFFVRPEAQESKSDGTV